MHDSLCLHQARVLPSQDCFNTSGVFPRDRCVKPQVPTRDARPQDPGVGHNRSVSHREAADAPSEAIAGGERLLKVTH